MVFSSSEIMPEFFLFWLDCIKRGATWGSGLLSIAEVLCVFIWLFYRRQQRLERKWEVIVKTLSKWGVLIIFPFGTLLIAPFLKYQEATKANEMVITVLVQNNEKEKIVIEPKFIGSFEESVGNSTSDYPEEAFRLFPKDKHTDKLSFVIPAGQSREYEITIPDTVNKKSLFEKGASDFIFTLNDGGGKAIGTIPFNKDAVHTQKAIVKF